MAKLVAVCRSDDYPFERRQTPLVVDDNLTMVLQFTDTCLGCDMNGLKQKAMEHFVQRFHALTKDEVAIAMMVTSREIFNLLSQLVPCVGCRKSVEKLFGQLVDTNYPSLDPLIITRSSGLSVKRTYLFDPRALYALFYVHGSKLNDLMDSIAKGKKNKRCPLHSLETHKSKAASNWMETWELMSKECREEVVLIDTDIMRDTLDTYLRKHRFCTECKAKVLRAYSILLNEINGNDEKGYCPALFEELRHCRDQQHIHIPCRTEYIASLIGRAEPELIGRERHAKTLDVAQEEVLTCIGLYIYDRLFKISQKVRSEEQTWQILFYLGVDALRKSFEVALENKQGISNLELICEELLEEERAKDKKREQKRQKKKKKKNNMKNNVEEASQSICIDCGKETCCDSVDKKSCSQPLAPSPKCTRAPCSQNSVSSPRPFDCNDNVSLTDLTLSCGRCDGSPKPGLLRLGEKASPSDCGYSSGFDGCESCSMPSSNGSDVLCLDAVCSNCECLESNQHECSGDDTYKTSPKHCAPRVLGLEAMLEESCAADEDSISEEDIRYFKANRAMVTSKRQELRERLRQRFSNLTQRTMKPSCSCDGAGHHH